MGYLGVYLKAHQLGQEAAEDVNKGYDLSTKSGKSMFELRAYEAVEALSQLGKYSYIGPELMKMKDPDAAVNKYDDAVADGIKSVMNKRIKAKAWLKNKKARK